MSQQPSIETVLKNTIAGLAGAAELTAAEIARLRLSDLHLAGKSPHLTIPTAEGEIAKKIDLDLDTHRMLVGWLVSRPDSVSELLFTGPDREPVSPDVIQAALTEQQAAAPEKPEQPTPPPPAGQPASPPARPAAPPPRSAPEMGAPPPGFQPGRVPFAAPPPMNPEAEGPPSFGPESDAAPEPSGPDRPTPPVPPEPFPARRNQPRVTPKPVRRRDMPAEPSIVKQKPVEPPSPTIPVAPVTAESSRPVPPPHPEIEPDATLISAAAPVIAPQPEPESVSPVAAEPAPAPVDPAATPIPESSTELADETLLAAAPPAPKSTDAPEATAAEPPAPSTEVPVMAPKVAIPASVVAGIPDLPRPKVAPPRSPQKKQQKRLPMLSMAVGGAVLVLLACFGCAGAGAWFYLQGDSQNILAGLLASPTETPALPTFTPTPTITATDTPESVFESPVSPVETPTEAPPPTETPTEIPTPSPPTDTPTALPTETETPAPTDTPAPPPVSTPVEDTPTPEPEASPASEFKYEARKLIGPRNGAQFDGINEIKLEWEPVELAADEQYAVRIVYRFNGQVTYGGAQVKEPAWVVPLNLRGQIDPPENHYDWFVVVERLNEDGSGTAISPESEHWSFVWR